MQLIYEKSISGRRGVKLPICDVPSAAPLPDALLRKEAAGLAELSELDLVRHFTLLSRRNFSVDTNFYPLGSCTMKYNPKVLENITGLFAPFHPMTAFLPGGADFCQGSLGMLFDLGQLLADITGMDEVTTQPLAGAQGEMTGIMLIAAYHKARGSRKKYVLVPDSSHGTNPASAAMAGYEIITVKTAPYGDMDIELFRQAMNDALDAGATTQAGSVLYEINQAAAQERDRIRNDPNLTAEQKEQQLKDIEQERLEAKAQVLGQEPPPDSRPKPQPPPPFQHNIAPGETLAGLSMVYHVPISELMKANPGFGEGLLPPGQTVKIPSQGQVSPPLPPPLPAVVGPFDKAGVQVPVVVGPFDKAGVPPR